MVTRCLRSRNPYGLDSYTLGLTEICRSCVQHEHQERILLSGFRRPRYLPPLSLFSHSFPQHFVLTRLWALVWFGWVCFGYRQLWDGTQGLIHTRQVFHPWTQGSWSFFFQISPPCLPQEASSTVLEIILNPLKLLLSPTPELADDSILAKKIGSGTCWGSGTQLVVKGPELSPQQAWGAAHNCL